MDGNNDDNVDNKVNNNHVVMSVSFMGPGTVCCHLGLRVGKSGRCVYV